MKKLTELLFLKISPFFIVFILAVIYVFLIAEMYLHSVSIY